MLISHISLIEICLNKEEKFKMELTVGSRLKHAWNAFLNRAPTGNYQYGIGGGYAYRPDRFRLTRGNERSIVTSVYNRIALDVAAINIQHVQLDDDGRFLNVIKSGLTRVYRNIIHNEWIRYIKRCYYL